MRMSRAVHTEPILASWKVARVVHEYPELIEELVAVNPAFKALRNPLKRRVQGNLVTVAQAAEIAGMPQADLVRRLNRAAGLSDEATEVVAAETREERRPGALPDWAVDPLVAAEVDARPLQRSGEEPFSAIIAALRQVPVGQVLLLLSTIEPIPLYDVLGQRGFAHWAMRYDHDDWAILFLNTGKPSAPTAPTPTPAPPEERDTPAPAPSATITIDVSELVPPEPLIRIMERLAELTPGETLLVNHVRRPIHLYPRLDAEGYRHETREVAPGHVEILIEKPALP
jgi:uncharacterized protein (DUF2249 family)